MNPSKDELIISAYSEYAKPLLQRAFFKLNDKDISDDLVQTTFLKTWEFLSKEKQITHIRGFLFHVLNNLIVDEYRKHKPVSLDVLEEAGFEIAYDNTEQLLNKSDGKTAMLLIPLLKEKHQKVLSMRFLEEKTIKEIAEATKQSRNTVSVQIRRGVNELAILFRAE